MGKLMKQVLELMAWEQYNASSASDTDMAIHSLTSNKDKKTTSVKKKLNIGVGSNVSKIIFHLQIPNLFQKQQLVLN